MPFELVIFDFDGTLADTRRAVVHSMAAIMAEELAVGTSELEINRVISSGATLPKAFAALAPAHAPAALGALVAAYRQHYSVHAGDLTVLYPGVIDMLNVVKEKGSVCVVISNKGEEALRHTLMTLGVLDYFDLVVGEHNRLPPKPDTALFEELIWPQYPAVPKESILMVGDTLADLQFADNAGIRKCWAKYGYGDLAVCEAYTSDYRVDDVYGLRTLLACGR